MAHLSAKIGSGKKDSGRWTPRLKTPRERTRDWVNPGCAGRDSDGFGWGSVPVVLPGVATAAGNAPGARHNDLRYAADTTLMAESEEELKNILMKVKGEGKKPGLNIQKTKILASGPITSWQIDGENMGGFYFVGLQNHCVW